MKSRTCVQPCCVSFTRWSGMNWWMSRFLFPSDCAWRINMIICECQQATLWLHLAIAPLTRGFPMLARRDGNFGLEGGVRVYEICVAIAGVKCQRVRAKRNAQKPHRRLYGVSSIINASDCGDFAGATARPHNCPTVLRSLQLPPPALRAAPLKSSSAQAQAQAQAQAPFVTTTFGRSLLPSRTRFR